MTYDEQISIYDQQIQIIKMDQGGKLFRDDDHGVMDCSADIRELKAEKRGFQKGYESASKRHEEIQAKTNKLQKTKNLSNPA